ncbi:50S ribosomal protein L22 [Candidatus Micrarchaeota archaeon CG1_02_55_22]|nr:MAG: 50S ribosomal protein L22 [Candidatus Micrarchaeota archaeon CG1_02_55_22]
MGLYKYSVTYDAEKSAPAQAFDINASYKDLTQVLRAIRGKSVKDAKKILDEAITLKRAIRFSKFNKGMGHRSELGGKKGKYPAKECRIALHMLNNAFANAQSKGLDENAVVLHAAAYKQNVFPRYRTFFVGGNTLGYGKQAIFSRYVTARAEIVVGEKGLKPLARKTKVQVRAEAKLKSKTPVEKVEKKADAKAKPSEAKVDAKAKPEVTEKPAKPAPVKVVEKPVEKPAVKQ